MKHVTVLAWSFPPGAAPAANRAVGMTAWLVSRGFRVTVITVNEEVPERLFGSDASRAAAVLAGVRIVPASFRPEPLNYVVNSWPEERQRRPARWLTQYQTDLTAEFPEATYPSWAPSALQALFTVHAEQPIDLVIATAAPYISFDVAAQFHAITDVAYILDDRDSFLYDVFTAEPLPDFARRSALYRRMVDASAGYWVVNEAIADLHRAQAGDGVISVVPNGWDSFAVGAAEVLRTRLGPGARLAFVGTVTTDFPAAELAAAWERFYVAYPDSTLRIVGRLGHARTGRSRAGMALADVSGVEVCGDIPRATLPALYNDLDALLFVKEGGSLVTSSKVYEYMATGLPIAALTAPGIGALDVLAGYPRLHWADLGDPVAGARAIADAAADGGADGPARDAACAHARRYAEQFERIATLDATMGPLIDEVLA